MEMNAVVANSLPIANAGQTMTSGGKMSGKADASSNPFGNLLQATADAGSSGHSDKKKATDPLLTLMMAINGGLTQALFAQFQATPANAQSGTADSSLGSGPIVQVNLGGQTLPIPLQTLSLTNGELAALLQKFGASPALLNNLLADPQGQPAQLLNAQPELLPAFAQALNQAVQSAIANPIVAAQDPQVADLMKSVLAQLTVTGNQAQESMTNQPNGTFNKQSSALGKLQATMSVHVLQTTASNQDATASTSAEQAPAPAQAPVQASVATDAKIAVSTLTLQPSIGTQQKQQAEQPAQAPSSSVLGSLSLYTPTQLQQPQPLASTNAPVVLMQANQFQTEFQNLIVKRAALIESPGSQEFRIVLQPQGMGEIEVRVQAVNNQISLHFAADSAQAKGLLDSGLSGLRSQLEAQGIRFDRIEVTTGYSNGEFNSGMSQERGSGQSFQGQSGGQSQKRVTQDPFTLESVQEAAQNDGSMTLDGLDGIDVIA